MEQPVILSASRTAIAAFQSTLSPMTAPQLGSVAIRSALSKAGIPQEELAKHRSEVIMGQVLAAGVGQAPARQASIYAGIPQSVPALTINKMCGSGLKAVMLAAQAIITGDAEIVVAGGQESMTNAPYLLPKARSGYRMGNGEIIDSMMHDGLIDAYDRGSMGVYGDMCAREYGFTREAQDEFAVTSYKRAQEAQQRGWFTEEIAAVEVPDKKGTILFTTDEGPSRAQFDKIPTLKPAFSKDGTVTAANASSINDGAAALVLTSITKARDLGIAPLARIIAQASYAQAPQWFTTAPVGAIRSVLAKAGLRPEDIDLYEINEAFAVVPMAVEQDLCIPRERINIHGGAIALGHPIGASGARILTTLLYALRRTGKRIGLATLCIGGGEASAVIVEML
ncbi:MAG: acetyl-CoA C-acetyltransferase [Bacteroidota bacterium]|nr:acetyl-CoA C-acetyltransferase [Candidatus Kapabacteria bacterium]MDW8220528.1 acetyl-CoA C-acetyltransferase [Bacteroidota bacterium]